jgi:hypothetical protein
MYAAKRISGRSNRIGHENAAIGSGNRTAGISINRTAGTSSNRRKGSPS